MPLPLPSSSAIPPCSPNQGMVKLTGPNPGWRNEADCGEDTYKRPDGTLIKLNCAGPSHAYFRDLDGTLFADAGNENGPSITAGVFGDAGRSFPYDQGTPVLPGPCTYNSVTKGYSCVPGSGSFLLAPQLKPSPTPPKGVFGNPQHFVLESRDADSETRNFGPVMFNVSGAIDLVSAAMDHVSHSGRVGLGCGGGSSGDTGGPAP